MAALSDERLVEHVSRGDQAAFEILYDRYSAGILGFCRHMLRSSTDAEDAVQHTFIAAHADIQRHGDRDLHVKAWLYTIARNRCLSMFRARREQTSDGDVELVTDRLQDDLQQREDLRALLADVSKLPDDQREALVLAEVGDLSHDDISSVLGCEASKVKSLVFQARTALIDRRIARETPCADIREQIATLRGGALRRSYLRHHIEACPGCAEYREDIRRQRAMLAIALPVIPSAALRTHVLGSVGIGGTTAAVSSAGAGATASGFGLAQASLAKLGIAAVVIAGGAGGAAVAKNGHLPLLHHSKSSASTHTLEAHGSAVHGGAASSSAAGTATQATGSNGHHTSHTTNRSAAGSEHGFTPVQGKSNGAAARQRAATRGQGNHTGIAKTHTNHRGGKHAAKTHVKHVATPRANSHASPKAHAEVPKTVAPKAHSTPKPTTAPKSTPKSTQPTPQPQATTPAPTPAPSAGGNGNGNAGTNLGKSLGNGKGAAKGSSG